MRYLLTLLLCGSLSAATYYVRKDGSDTANDGLSDNAGGAWLTIGKAAATVNAGDTVYVRAGTYQENVTLTTPGTSGSRITWIGERDGDDWLTIVDPSYEVSSSGWTQATGEFTGGDLVWKKTLAQLPVEPGAVIVDGKIVIGYSHTSYTDYNRPWTSEMGLPANSTAKMDEWQFGSGLFWEGVDAAYRYQTNTDTLYVRFRNGESPATKSSVRVSYKGRWRQTFSVTDAPFRVLAGYQTISNFHIRGAHIPIALNGVSAPGVIIEDNHIEHGFVSILLWRASGGSIASFDGFIARRNLIHSNRHGSVSGEWSRDVASTWPQYVQYARGKYCWGASTEGAGIASIFGQKGLHILNNTITNHGAGTQMFADNNPYNIVGAENNIILSNWIANISMSGIGTSAGWGNLVIASNDLYRVKYPMRFQNFNIGVRSTGAYQVYGNRIFKEFAFGEGMYLHAWPIEKYPLPGDPPTTPSLRQEIWIYHNTVSGGNVGMMFSEYFNYEGLPKLYIINNLFSGAQGIARTANSGTWYWPPEHLGSLDYNAYMNRSGSLVIADAGPNNVILPSLEWPTGTDPSDWIISADSAARAAGIDISDTFTVNGVSHSALPGFSPGYFESDIGPDIGAWQYSPGAEVPLVSVTATDPLAHESLLTTGTFTLTRTESLTGTLTVDYTISGTATAGTDYVDDLGTSITFADGDGSTNLVVTPLGNGGWFGNQTVIITLDEDAAYLLRQPTSATITIVEGDSEPGALTRPSAPGHSPATSRIGL